MRNSIPFLKSAPTVAVVRLSGIISSSGRGALNDVSLRPMLEKAFKKGKPKVVALVINSPGGSPVQSSLIAARIRRLSAEHDVPVIAFVEDVAASGGYWLASAADEIWADESSIVGSIGVISMGFGFNQAMERIGVERRVYTAGKSKSMLDPFQPEKPDDIKRLKGILEHMHTTFKAQIMKRRAGKLPEDKDLFTGEIWIGTAALEVGLIDGIDQLEPLMKERFGDKVKFIRYGGKRSLLQKFGLRIVDDALDGLEERAHYARFGL
ncbi:MAG TPA: S49 family peptidase [Rhodobacteraceae bacterium]|jgi:serine protease SohB|nr:S49 family peptidase [Paracoccaceae bacterium]